MGRAIAWAGVVPVALAALLALAMLLANEWSHRDARALQASLAERTAVRVTTQTLLRRLVDAETAQRGYLLTGRTDYLEPYRNADADVMTGLARVKAHFADEPDTAALLDALTRGAGDKLSELSTTIALYDGGDHPGWQAVLAGDQGRVAMDGVRSAAAQLLAAEDRRIDSERAVVNRLLERDRLITHTMTLLALCALIFFVRKNLALQRAQAAHASDLREQRDALERKVAARTEELRELTAHLQDVREVERAHFARHCTTISARCSPPPSSIWRGFAMSCRRCPTKRRRAWRT